MEGNEENDQCLNYTRVMGSNAYIPLISNQIRWDNEGRASSYRWGTLLIPWVRNHVFSQNHEENDFQLGHPHKPWEKTMSALKTMRK